MSSLLPATPEPTEKQLLDRVDGALFSFGSLSTAGVLVLVGFDHQTATNTGAVVGTAFVTGRKIVQYLVVPLYNRSPWGRRKMLARSQARLIILYNMVKGCQTMGLLEGRSELLMVAEIEALHASVFGGHEPGERSSSRSVADAAVIEEELTKIRERYSRFEKRLKKRGLPNAELSDS